MVSTQMITAKDRVVVFLVPVKEMTQSSLDMKISRSRWRRTPAASTPDRTDQACQAQLVILQTLSAAAANAVSEKSS